MKTNILATAASLSDGDLLVRIDALATNEREATAELIAHLAALDLRPSLYAAQGYGSLFAYCTQALHLSEDAACNRIEAARACRSFPVILDLLGSGSLTLSAARRLRPHLTPENHEGVLARASHRTKEEIQILIAELAPKPDVLTSVRKLPVPNGTAGPRAAMSSPAATVIDSPANTSAPTMRVGGEAQLGSSGSPAFRPPARPIVQPLSPQRYRVQFTIGQETHDELRRVQALLRREIPDGDPAVIFGRAVHLLLEQIEKSKLGKTARPRGQRRYGAPATRAYENRIRPGTDKNRHIPSEVKRKVWWRDAGQCAFVSSNGRRCTERSFLELHHIQPYAMDGPATIGNISLRCRRHNQYEAGLVFGPRTESMALNQAQMP